MQSMDKACLDLTERVSCLTNEARASEDTQATKILDIEARLDTKVMLLAEEMEKNIVNQMNAHTKKVHAS